MLEMDCVYNGLRNDFEIGETEDQMISYFKHKRPIDESIVLLRILTSRFGLTSHILAKKIDENGNIIKVRFLYDGSWD